MNLLDILAFYNQASVFVKDTWEIAKERMRLWLGPSSQNYLLLKNGDILPTYMDRTLLHEEGAYLYNATDKTIRLYPSEDRGGRLRRLPWLSVQHVAGQVVTDLSDSVADIRATQQTWNLQQIVRLMALVRNEYLSEKAGAQVKVITALGDEEVYIYSGSVALTKAS